MSDRSAVRALLGLFRGPALLVDADGIVLAANPHAREALDHALVGTSLSEVLDEARGAGWDALDAEIRRTDGLLPHVVQARRGQRAWRVRAQSWRDARGRPEVIALALDPQSSAAERFVDLTVRMDHLRRRLETQRELQEELDRTARTDDLTGLLNRRGLGLSWREVRGPGAVAVIDLDHFKQVNDQHGHQAGDEVLRRFGEAARATCRGADLLARIGGDEFVLALPGAPLDAARGVVRRLRARLDDAGPEGPVTFSAGIAGATLGTEASLEAALAAADEALYRAKRRGRDRTLTDDDAEA